MLLLLLLLVVAGEKARALQSVANEPVEILSLHTVNERLCVLSRACERACVRACLSSLRCLVSLWIGSKQQRCWCACAKSASLALRAYLWWSKFFASNISSWRQSFRVNNNK
jgi:hypothetical protein